MLAVHERAANHLLRRIRHFQGGIDFRLPEPPHLFWSALLLGWIGGRMLKFELTGV